MSIFNNLGCDCHCPRLRSKQGLFNFALSLTVLFPSIFCFIFLIKRTVTVNSIFPRGVLQRNGVASSMQPKFLYKTPRGFLVTMNERTPRLSNNLTVTKTKERRELQCLW
jgi:hypothetical protein